jgi:hypothetical protein
VRPPPGTPLAFRRRPSQAVSSRARERYCAGELGIELLQAEGLTSPLLFGSLDPSAMAFLLPCKLQKQFPAAGKGGCCPSWEDQGEAGGGQKASFELCKFEQWGGVSVAINFEVRAPSPPPPPPREQRCCGSA